ncbi:mycofactocin biosynthesis chaperone MftB [Tsukamurella sp. PLM1]|uniref:mycofactocin biosynthesis chaperone MftB n=1 Tax=Tsukamurella sp. PLM1 TaxID=2929795 RepID=UPI00205AED4F|nr:putative mycofactocin system protein MftB [Tsukamurella sp. PLM1]
MLFDTSLSWRLNPRVAVRPEPFGALLYHFGTRKLSFLKDLVVVDLVRTLHTHPSADDALDAAPVAPADRPRYVRTLDALCGSGMIIPATDQE